MADGKADSPAGLPGLIWVIQNSHITPFQAAFLDIVRQRVSPWLTLFFMVPSTDARCLKTVKALSPVTYGLTVGTIRRSPEIYERKKAVLGSVEFAQGLRIADALLLDDFGGGNGAKTDLAVPRIENVRGVLLQIPTPLGSLDMEEQVFHAWILWAGRNGLPVYGYEFLPLDTQWTLAPSMVDGIILTTPGSPDPMQKALASTGKPIWRLPRHERNMLSPFSSQFHLNGARASFHYRHTCGLPPEVPVVYIPHNVALIREYRSLIRAVLSLGRVHLMIAVARDQSRGSWSHQEIVEITCRDLLKHEASHSFHDINAHWEMAMATAVVACASCFSTYVAETNRIPVIILDGTHPPESGDSRCCAVSEQAFLGHLREFLEREVSSVDLSTLLIQLCRAPGRGR